MRDQPLNRGGQATAISNRQANARASWIETESRSFDPAERLDAIESSTETRSTSDDDGADDAAAHADDDKAHLAFDIHDLDAADDFLSVGHQGSRSFGFRFASGSNSHDVSGQPSDDSDDDASVRAVPTRPAMPPPKRQLRA